MRCYSHLSDDEREQIGLAKAVGHSIGAIAKAIGRPKSTVSRELLGNRLPSGRCSPLHAAGAYQLRRRREALIERSSLANLLCRPAGGRVDPRANFRLAQGRKRTSSACRGLRDDLRVHLQGRPTGRAVTALSHAPAQTPPPAPVETFARYNKDRVSIHERPKKVDARTEGGPLGG
jgi:IS30 family transposase